MSNSSPVFSIIMPTYNRASVISKPLNAIVNQTMKEWELIVIDDGGTDNTQDIIEAIGDARIRYIKTENRGPLKARAHAATLKRGSWLVFCDSDDIWAESYLETMFQATEYFDVDVVFSDYIVEGERDSRLKKPIEANFFEPSVEIKQNNFWKLNTTQLYHQFMLNMPIMPSALCLCSQLYESIGGLDTTLDITGSEDAHLSQRACAHAKSVALVTDPLVTIGRGDDNLSSNFTRNLSDGAKILEDFVSRGLVPQHLIPSTLASIDLHYFKLGKFLHWDRNYRESVSAFSKIVDKKPYKYEILKFKCLGIIKSFVKPNNNK